MTYRKKSWTEKLQDSKKFPKTLKFDPKFPCGKALQKMGAKPGDTVVLAAPIEVDEIMKNVPKGKLITINEICKKLAKRHNTKFCCTLTTGIFIMTAAHAAEEAKAKGERVITPYWRTLKMSGVLNDKYPGGAEAQKKSLEKEGFRILQKGRKYIVENYENYLMM